MSLRQAEAKKIYRLLYEQMTGEQAEEQDYEKRLRDE
jgi:hypothetical protein